MAKPAKLVSFGAFLAFAIAFFALAPLAYAQLGCDPGAKECTDTTHYRECGEFAIWGDPIACEGGSECVNGNCEPKLGCQPGARECIDSSSFRICNNFALWDPAQDCLSYQSCVNGYCTPEPQCSQPEQTRCSPNDANQIQICNYQRQWVNFRACDYGCYNGYCRACRPGNTRCSDSHTYQTCDSSGQWGSDTRCGNDYVCDGGSCVVSPLLRCNSVGAFRCSPDNSKILQRCENSLRWQDYHVCDIGCAAGACKACNYGDAKCQDPFTYQTCAQNGQWGYATSCPNGYTCYAGTCRVASGNQCSAGDKRCSPTNPSMAQACGPNYIFTDFTLCPDGCTNGICNECKPGTSVCAGATTYRTCTSYGQLSEAKSCATGFTCDHGQCVATPQCADGARNCVSDSIYVCKSGAWELLIHCPSDTDCKESSGTAYCQAESQSGSSSGGQQSSQQPSQQQQQASSQPQQQALQPESGKEPMLGTMGYAFAALSVLLVGLIAYLVHSKKLKIGKY